MIRPSVENSGVTRKRVDCCDGSRMKVAKYPKDQTGTARENIDSQKNKQAAKTARLREARLAKEAAEGGEPAPTKPRAGRAGGAGKR